MLTNTRAGSMYQLVTITVTTQRHKMKQTQMKEQKQLTKFISTVSHCATHITIIHEM